jgi:hypothetical protein
MIFCVPEPINPAAPWLIDAWFANSPSRSVLIHLDRRDLASVA